MCKFSLCINFAVGHPWPTMIDFYKTPSYKCKLWFLCKLLYSYTFKFDLLPSQGVPDVAILNDNEDIVLIAKVSKTDFLLQDCIIHGEISKRFNFGNFEKY